MQKSDIKYILIACCTCNRPNMLKRSLESIENLILPEGIRIELLIIDNDQYGSAQYVIEEFNNNFPVKIHYFIEPNRGISNARNKLLKEALNLGASHIAMFDDDEIVDKNWLFSYFNYYRENPEANIISGPTYNKFDRQYPSYIMKNNIFKSSTTKKTGLIRHICASGNVFFPTTIMSEANIYFDNSYIFMGGEDGDFFSRASSAGFTIIWNNDAVNYEMIGDERANIRWILDRSYYNGYSGAILKFKNQTRISKKLIYTAKTLGVLIANCLILPFSFVLGIGAGLNVLGMAYKTAGKLTATIQDKPLNYYKEILGK